MTGFPIDSHVTYDADGTPIYDRAVSSAPLRKLIKELFSDGVMPNPSTNMQVTADGKYVVVNPGFAICNGCLKLAEEQTQLTIQPPDTSYARIDTVVLRLDDNDAVRSCEFAVLKGTPSANPVRCALTRNASVWEIGLADIRIPAGASGITNANVIDTRYESKRCGVISSISEFDTTTLYQQIKADLAEFKAEEQVSFTEFKEEEQAAFVRWFENIKNQLSADAAGNLQNQINGMKEYEVKNNVEEGLHLIITDSMTTILVHNTKTSGTNLLIQTHCPVLNEISIEGSPYFDFPATCGEKSCFVRISSEINGIYALGAESGMVTAAITLPTSLINQRLIRI